MDFNLDSATTGRAGRVPDHGVPRPKAKTEFKEDLTACSATAACDSTLLGGIGAGAARPARLEATLEVGYEHGCGHEHAQGESSCLPT